MNRSSANVVLVTAATELCLFLRDRLTPLKIFVVLALSIALVPPNGASYAVIAVANHPLDMSANTAMLSAAVVLAIMVVALFPTSLNVGRSRDIDVGVARLFSTQPASTKIILVGRVAANLVSGLFVTTFAVAVLSATLWWRYAAPPNLTTIVLSMAVVFPTFAIATLIGATFDLVLPKSASVKITVLFVFWTMAVMLSVFGPLDVIGFQLLRSMLSVGAAARKELSLGFVSSVSTSAIPWKALAGDVGRALIDRLVLLVGIIGCAMVLIAALGNRLYRTPLTARGASTKSPERELTETTARALQNLRHDANIFRPSAFKPAGLFRTQILLLQRILLRSRLGSILILLGMVAGSAAPKPGIAAIALLLSPIFLFAPTQTSELKVARSLEMIEPALQRPRPFALLVITLIAILLFASIPALMRMGVFQAATFALGLSSMVLWIVWTHRVTGTPVLGVGIAGALIYVTGLNDVPAQMDVLGIWHQSTVALGVMALLFAALVIVTSLLSSRR